MEMRPVRIVVWSDVQYPYHDTETDRAFNRFLADFQPDFAVLNGDGLDFPTISRFDRNPVNPTSIRAEVEGFKAYLREKSRILGPNCHKHFNEGNHEDRLRKYLWRQAPALSDLGGLSLQSLLDLGDWSYTPYYDPMNVANGSPDASPGIDISGLLVIHGCEARKWSGMTARECYNQFGGSGITGHTHRLAAFYHTKFDGGGDDGIRELATYVWLEGGCMCSLTPPYEPAPDWQQGFVAGYLLPDGGASVRFDIRQVPIIHNKFMWNGQL